MASRTSFPTSSRWASCTATSAAARGCERGRGSRNFSAPNAIPAGSRSWTAAGTATESPRTDPTGFTEPASRSGFRRPFSEDRRSHAHDGGAFSDRRFEVVAHAHRKFAGGEKSALARGIAEFTKARKVGAHVVGILQIRRNRHEAVDRESLSGSKPFQ